MTSALDRAVNAAQIDVWRAQLVAARKLQRLSQRALGERVGTSQSQVWDWENGVYTPTIGSWLAWAAAVGFELQLVPQSDQRGVQL